MRRQPSRGGLGPLGCIGMGVAALAAALGGLEGVQTQPVEPIREHLQSGSAWRRYRLRSPCSVLWWGGMARASLDFGLWALEASPSPRIVAAKTPQSDQTHMAGRQGQLGPSRPSMPGRQWARLPRPAGRSPSPNSRLDSDRSQFRFPTFGKNWGTGHVGGRAVSGHPGLLQFGAALGTTWPAIKQPEFAPQPSTAPAARTRATRSSTQHYPEPLHAHHGQPSAATLRLLLAELRHHTRRIVRADQAQHFLHLHLHLRLRLLAFSRGFGPIPEGREAGERVL